MYISNHELLADAQSWISNGTYEYWISKTDALNWEAAKQNCTDMQASLTSILDEAEHEFVNQHLDPK